MACEECERLKRMLAEQSAQLKQTYERNLRGLLDLVQGQINAAKGNLDDAEKIIGRMI